MKKRWSDFLRARLSLLLAVVLALSLLPLSALAADDTPTLPAGWPETSWAEEVKTQTWKQHGLDNGATYRLPTVDDDTGAVTYETVTVDGTKSLGTKENPIAISTPEELILFGQLTDSTEGEYYILTETEYDMSDHYMTPLFPASPGSSGEMNGISFEGTLIGNGAVVTGAKIQTFETDGQVFCGGLFGKVSGGISGLTLKDSTIVLADSSSAGGLATQLQGTLADCHVENVSFWGSVVDNVYSSASLGGLVGDAQGSIADCTTDISYAEVSNTVGSYAWLCIGGLVGKASGMTIVKCRANVRDSIQLSDWDCGIKAGGLAGYVYNNMTITDCTATVRGSITANATRDAYAGGLVGDFYGTMTNCTATVDGTITATTTSESSEATAGALVGNNSNSWNPATITDCKAEAQTGPDGPLGATGHATGEVTVSDTSTTLLLGSGGVSVTLKGGDKATSVTEDGNGKLTMTFSSPPTGDVGVTRKDGVTVTVPSGTTDLAVSSDGTITYAGTAMYYVTFDSQGGSDVPGVYTADDGKVTEPSAPTRNGYRFTGWYTDSACTADSLWNFETGTVTAPLTLYAGWEAIPEPEPEPEPEPRPDPDPDPDPIYRPDVERTEGGTVETRPSNPTEGNRVTITPKPDRGYEVDEVTVTDREGDPVEVTRREDGTYTFRQPRGRVTIRVTYRPVETAWVNPFADVTQGDWYYDAVEYVQKNGLMAGTSTTTFSPGVATSRGMVVTILWRLSGSPDLEDEIWGYPFADVDAGAYYGTAVYWARLNGIADGYGDGTFGPDAPVTREQLAVMLYNCAGQPPVPDLALTFDDAGQISGFADSAMRWAVDAGILSGQGGGLLDPGGRATRAQVAVMLMRFCENVTG